MIAPHAIVRSRLHDYPVWFERGGLSRAGERLSKHAGGSLPGVVVVSDRNVLSIHGGALSRAIQAAPLTTIALEPGEASKSFAVIERTCEALASAGADRGAWIVALGGGVVTDVAGFVAATFARGIPWLAIPTTLVGQADAAIGGKTGIDLAAGKNLVGAFHPPRAVIVDPELLASLSPEERTCGLGELLKYGVIAGDDLFDRVRALGSAATAALQPGTLDGVLRDAIAIKADLCSQDELDAGPRRVLNLGHTIGHAVEAACEYRGPRHGEAVAIGMVAEACLAESLGLASPGLAARIAAACQGLGLPVCLADSRGRTSGDRFAAPDQALLDRAGAALSRDKKRPMGGSVFALPAAIGKVEIVALEDSDRNRREIDDALRRAIQGPAPDA